MFTCLSLAFFYMYAYDGEADMHGNIGEPNMVIAVT